MPQRSIAAPPSVDVLVQLTPQGPTRPAAVPTQCFHNAINWSNTTQPQPVTVQTAVPTLSAQDTTLRSLAIPQELTAQTILDSHDILSWSQIAPWSQSRGIHVHNLDRRLQIEQVKDFFSAEQSLTVVQFFPLETTIDTWQAVVEYESVLAARKAIEYFNQTELFGKQIGVDFAQHWIIKRKDQSGLECSTDRNGYVGRASTTFIKPAMVSSPPCCVAIDGLGWSVSEDQILTYFSDNDQLEIERITHQTNEKGNPSNRILVAYCTPEGAMSAIGRFDRTMYASQRLRVGLHLAVRKQQTLIPSSDSVNTLFVIAISNWPPQATTDIIRELLARAGICHQVAFRVDSRDPRYPVKKVRVMYQSAHEAQRAIFIFHGLKLYQDRPELQARPVSKPTYSPPDAWGTNPDSNSDAHATRGLLIRGLPSAVSEVELEEVMSRDGQAVNAWVLKLPGQDASSTLATIEYTSKSIARGVRKTFDGAKAPNSWMVEVCFDQHPSVLRKDQLRSWSGGG